MGIFSKACDRIVIHGRALITIGRTVTDAKMLLAKLVNQQIAALGQSIDIQRAEFKVFSQFGEDGIIQYLVRQTQIMPAEKSFVEFGAETFSEANAIYLVMNDNWRGLLIDGSEKNVRFIRKLPFFWKHDLHAVAGFITKDNVNELIGGGGYRGDIGLLSIDIDGNDYWVWNALTVVNPVIVVAEYNSVYGPSRAVTVPYNPSFTRMAANSTGLYFGCSLKALELCAESKGYALVGSNTAGNNAFFVRKDRLNGQPALTSEQAYVYSRFRESVDKEGKFTFLAGQDRLMAIADMPLYDIEKGANILAGELLTGA